MGRLCDYAGVEEQARQTMQYLTNVKLLPPPLLPWVELGETFWGASLIRNACGWKCSKLIYSFKTFLNAYFSLHANTVNLSSEGQKLFLEG